ncbi:MAG: hypothetical protein J5517_06365 [Eubacterium sp.]|nr:hypothetical protein [Eubacterium sp.]
MKCAIYPYSDDLYVLLEHQERLIDDIKICAVIYPPSWRKQIYHINFLDNISSGSDYEQLIDSVECVIFADIKDRDYMYSDLLQKAECSLSNGKDVIFCTKIDEKDLCRFKKDYPDCAITVKYENKLEIDDAIIYKHEDIKCAAIGVGGLYRGLNHTVAVTEVSFEFQKKEIITTTVVDNATLTLLGFYQFPTHIFESQTDIEQQVGKLNTFFNNLENKTRCDLMVIQFPDGLMKFMDSTMDAYGVKTFMLTRAVSFDYFVLGTLLEITNIKAYDCIRSILSERFNLSMDACVFQPLNIDRESSDEDQKINYTRNRIDERFDHYDELKKTMNNIIVDYYDDNNVYRTIAEDFIKKFS